MKKVINVTKPFLPPMDEYSKLLELVWKRNWLTNDGPFVRQLEEELQKKLGVTNLLYVTNGTIALQIALKALSIKGEVITTPYSYVATTSSIVWESCEPVFVDIDQKTFNIDPLSIEDAITDKTTAILATHVYGNPCDIDAIQKIADKYSLKVIYDAAHCFGSKYKGKSVLEYGDISTISFHATKLFHTTEGGGIVTNNQSVYEKISFLRNFGHNGPDKFNGVGINGKNSEFHAAMGLVNLKYIDVISEKRKKDHGLYDQELATLSLKKQKVEQEAESNYSYYPVLFKDKKERDFIFDELAKEDVHVRKYFYPLLNKLDYVQHKDVKHAEQIADRVLCLPLYYDLPEDEIKLVSGLICKLLKQ